MAMTPWDRIAALAIACRAECDAAERAESAGNRAAAEIYRKRLTVAMSRLAAARQRAPTCPKESPGASGALASSRMTLAPRSFGLTIKENIVSPIPSIEAIKALYGRIFAMLNTTELETLEFYRAQGRKYGVSVSIINKADPNAVAAAKSRQEADHIMKSANSLISVVVQ